MPSCKSPTAELTTVGDWPYSQAVGIKEGVRDLRQIFFFVLSRQTNYGGLLCPALVMRWLGGPRLWE